jgi:Mce-associated membrane protein
MPRRIAGQRRRPENEVEVNPRIEQSEAVTQATSAAPEVSSVQDRTPSFATESDKSLDLERPVEPAPAENTPAPARSRVGVVLSAALGVLLVLIMALTGILGVKAWKGKEAEDARDQAAAAGRKAAETALSYDYRTLDKSFAAARATMTPEFAGQFDATAKVAGELATKTKATVRAEVREVGVRDGDANRVTLIIFVNQTTTSTITKGSPRVDLNRTRFTMVRNGHQWLVQEIAGL